MPNPGLDVPSARVVNAVEVDGSTDLNITGRSHRNKFTVVRCVPKIRIVVAAIHDIGDVPVGVVRRCAEAAEHRHAFERFRCPERARRLHFDLRMQTDPGHATDTDIVSAMCR